MARYFFHLRDGTDELLDPDGIECADMEALRQAVLHSARGLRPAIRAARNGAGRIEAMTNTCTSGVSGSTVPSRRTEKSRPCCCAATPRTTTQATPNSAANAASITSSMTARHHAAGRKRATSPRRW